MLFNKDRCAFRGKPTKLFYLVSVLIFAFGFNSLASVECSHQSKKKIIAQLNLTRELPLDQAYEYIGNASTTKRGKRVDLEIMPALTYRQITTLLNTPEDLLVCELIANNTDKKEYQIKFRALSLIYTITLTLKK